MKSVQNFKLFFSLISAVTSWSVPMMLIPSTSKAEIALITVAPHLATPGYIVFVKAAGDVAFGNHSWKTLLLDLGLIILDQNIEEMPKLTKSNLVYNGYSEEMADQIWNEAEIASQALQKEKKIISTRSTKSNGEKLSKMEIRAELIELFRGMANPENPQEELALSEEFFDVYSELLFIEMQK